MVVYLLSCALCRVFRQLRPCLERIYGVRVLWSGVEAMRAETYSQENSEHERSLLQLWNQLMPSTSLESRITKQWQEIGFQGSNPATDFRSMGVLSLHCMLYPVWRGVSLARGWGCPFYCLWASNLDVSQILCYRAL